MNGGRLEQYARMHLRAAFLAWPVAAASAATPVSASAREPGSSRSASVFATVGHSEWCPPGTVRLDLGTGRYTVTAPRTWRTCRRPPYRSRVRTGALAADALAGVRAAYQVAVSEGLGTPACHGGIVVGNGGIPSLRLTSSGRTMAPPDDASCWSHAAWRLQRLLNSLFNPRTDSHR